VFKKLGRVVAWHPVGFIVFWLVIAGCSGVGALLGFGQGGLFARLESSMSLVPGSESDQVNNLTTTSGGESVMVVVKGIDVANQVPQLSQFMAKERPTLTDVAGVATVTDPIQMLAAPDPAVRQQAGSLISQNQDGFIVNVKLDEALNATDQRQARDDTHSALASAVDQFATDLAAEFPGASTTQVSRNLLSGAIISQVQDDLVTGEAISLPVALILLVLVFGGVMAAGLPLAGAILSIVVGLGAIWGLTFLTTVDSFILNVLTIIGLALSIDYGLLVVSRYREELSAELTRRGYPNDGSVVPPRDTAKEIVRHSAQATVATAGRTVSFSAMTIALAMCSLLPMRSPMMKTVAIAGITVTLLAVLLAVTVVPALIVLMNRILIKPSVLTRIPGVRLITRQLGDTVSDHGFFSRLAHGVHGRPWWVMLLVAVVLGVMAFPIQHLKMRTVFDDFLPQDHAVVQAWNTVQSDYPYVRQSSVMVIADQAPADSADLFAHLQSLDNVDFVTPPRALPGDDSRTLLSVHVDVADQVGTEVTNMVKDLRAYDAGVPLLVGGPAALQYDFVQSVWDAAPWALAIMVGAVFVLLFLMTGSLIVPCKALVINSLSLIASLGTASFIFEHGLFGMPAVPGMETFIVVMIICFGFGLAMDYEVFLLARIKEFWDAGHPNDQAVEMGLQRSGRIITSAAAIIVAVFIGFTFGNMGAIKQIGVTLAITVITDATLVRMLLVPATMTVLGRWNWWAPKPLRAIYRHTKTWA